MWIQSLRMSNNLKEPFQKLGEQVVSRRGFSFMELVVTLVIIGILSSTAYMSYQGYRHKARSYTAKKNLSTIVAFAETFYPNNGFYLPNLYEMDFQMLNMGPLNYNYKIICDNEANDILWTSEDASNADMSKACGDFDFDNRDGDDLLIEPTTTPPFNNNTNKCVDNGANGDADCWAGYVLCHYLPGKTSEPEPKVLPPKDGEFDCGTRKIPNKGKVFTGGFVFIDPEDFHVGVEHKVKTIHNFHIVDHAAFCGGKSPQINSGTTGFESNDFTNRRKSRDNDLFKESEPCISIKEHAVLYSDIKTIMMSLDDWLTNEKDFISNPNKLVITALACKKSQSDGCGDGSDKVREYDVIRMDTDRVVKNYQGSASF